MQDQILVPQARSGFSSLSTSAAVIMQLNPNGEWANSKPDDMDEDKLKMIVNYLVRKHGNTGSVCSQCVRDNGNAFQKEKHVPVILMPIQNVDDCPFDIEGIVKNKKVSRKKVTKADATDKKAKDAAKNAKSERGPERKMCRLTNFDLLSQW